MALASAWRRVLPWYPGDWIWPSLLAFLIAGVGAAVAIASTRGGGGGETIVATTTFTVEPPAPPTTVAQRPPPALTAPPPKPRPTGLIPWPGANGYTVVLASLPVSGGLAVARQKAKEALARGLPQVGVLRSDHFSSLHPGYYVVFSGVYVSLDDALTAASSVHSKFPSAYARPIAR